MESDLAKRLLLRELEALLAQLQDRNIEFSDILDNETLSALPIPDLRRALKELILLARNPIGR